MRKAGVAITILALGALVWGVAGVGLPLGPDVAQAGHGRDCGIVAKGSKNFRVVARKVKCRRARRGARKYLRHHQPLRGFTCQPNVPPYRFVCVKPGTVARYDAERI